MTPDDPDAKPKSQWLYRLCVTLGVIGGVIGLCSGLFFIAVPYVRDSATELDKRGTFNQLALGVHNMNDAHDQLPGPFHDEYSRLTELPIDPADRLSWRVTLLPYVEQDWLYTKIDKTQAWNSAANFPTSNTGVRAYTDPFDTYASTHTPYRVFYDNGALWDSDPKRRVPLDKIPDGSSNTILVVESTVQVPWAQFNEHPFDPNGPLPELGRASRNKFLVAMADGSVRTVKKSVSPNTLRAAITRAGNDTVGSDW